MNEDLPMRSEILGNVELKVLHGIKEIEEEKFVQGEKVSDDDAEQDIIIKCGLDEIVKHFFKDYIIVWHDPNLSSEENQQFIIQLEKFCQVKTFTEWKQASVFIQEAKAACHVMTSGTNGELLVKEIGLNQHVEKIYIFCVNKDHHSIWAKNYQKVSCVENEIPNVIDKIQQNLLEWYKKASSLTTNLPAFAPIFNDGDKSSMNNLHRYLKVLPKFRNRSQAQKDIIALSRAIYSDSENISFIKAFEKNYSQFNKETILRWYTKDSFLYRVTNNCLRIATSDSIQYCRLLLKDIEQAIKEQYQEKSKNFHGLLFRGAYLSEEEWSNLKSNLDREIEMHGFLSATKDKKKAMEFTKSDPKKKVFITILVPKGPNESEQGFAEVEEFSNFPKEQEVLFNVRSRFTVLETEDGHSKDLPYRHLVLLYGAQGFRKEMTEKSLVQEITIPPIDSISCCHCHGSISKIAEKMFFKSISESTENFFCRACLPNELESKNAPLLCIPAMRNPNSDKHMEKIKVQGILMLYPRKFELPMYGYKCCECQKKKERMYFKCTECNEKKNVWCESCIKNEKSCMEAGHIMILERSPFSFWCEKMPRKELDHFKFQNRLMEFKLPDMFQQGTMYFESLDYQRAFEVYNIYIQQNKEKKKDFNLGLAYISMGRVYEFQGELEKALKCYFKSLEIMRSIDGDKDKNWNIAVCYNFIAQANCLKGDFKDALEYYSKALVSFKSIHGERHDWIATIKNNMALIYKAQAEYKEALEYFFEGLEISKANRGENDPEIATSYNNIGHVYEDQGEYEQALLYCTRALNMYKSFYGDNHTQVAISYNNIAMIYQAQAKYKDALEFFSKALEMFKLSYGDNNPHVAKCYNNLASVHLIQAEYKSALEYYFKALKIYQSAYGEIHPDIGMCLHNISSLYMYQEQIKISLEYSFKALEVFKSCYGDNHPDMTMCYNNIGESYQMQGESLKALDYYYKALEILKSSYGDSHPKIAVLYLNMGESYRCQGKNEKALEYLSKALEMRKSIYGENHPDVAICLNNLALTYQARAEYKEALKYYFKALEIFKSFYNGNHPNITMCLRNLARLYKIRAESEDPVENYTKAIETYRIIDGDNRSRIATCYYEMAAVCQTQEEYKSAFEYSFEALTLMKSLYGDNHPDTIAVNNQMLAINEAVEERHRRYLIFLNILYLILLPL